MKWQPMHGGGGTREELDVKGVEAQLIELTHALNHNASLLEQQHAFVRFVVNTHPGILEEFRSYERATKRMDEANAQS